METWALRPLSPVCGGEGGSWDNHLLSGQSDRLSAAPAHGSLGSSMQLCSAPVSVLGFPTQRGVVKRSTEGWRAGGFLRTGWARGWRRREDEESEEEEEERGKRKDVARPLVARQVTLSSLHSVSSPSSSTQALPGCLSVYNDRFSAEISRYWIPGLEFCPPTMSRQQSMLQGRHTLQAKSWKTIRPFISIWKEQKSCLPSHPHPPSLFFLHHPFSSPSFPQIKTWGRLWSSVKLH